MFVDNLSEEEMFVILALREPIIAEEIIKIFKRIGTEKLFEFCDVNGVAPIIYHRIKNILNLDNNKEWSKSHEDNHKRISSYLTELDRITDLLDEAGVPLIALKNGGIARGLYHCVGCCPMGDLDVLVEKRNFRCAHQIMIASGYHFEFRNPLQEAALKVAESSGSAEYWKILPTGEKLWFELQWRPVAGRWLRPDQEPTAEELMDKSISIPDTKVRLLSPEDNLLQVALHTAKHSYMRGIGIRLHLDVDRIVRGQIIDWDNFIERVSRLQAKTAVYFSLAISKSLFHTPIPDKALQCIKPMALKEIILRNWLKRVGFFDPDERKFGRIGYIIFTVLLYDDLKGLWRSIFPDKAWIREQYGTGEDQGLPGLYLKRLIDLTFRRVST